MHPVRLASSSARVSIQSMVRITSQTRHAIIVSPSSNADPAVGWQLTAPIPFFTVTGSRRQPNAMGSIATTASHVPRPESRNRTGSLHAAAVFAEHVDAHNVVYAPSVPRDATTVGTGFAAFLGSNKYPSTATPGFE